MDHLKLFLPILLLISTGFITPVAQKAAAFTHRNVANMPARVKPAAIKWVVESGCSLKVAGTTNVNKFNCTIMSYAKPDTLSICKNSEGKPLKVSGEIAVPVKTFDCKHAMITKDLRKTLKAETFPNLVIRFMSLSKYPEFTGEHQAIKGVVSIELAGETRQYEVDYQFITEGSKNINLIGKRKVKFSDFNLSPPKKAGGMIRTNDELSVEFNLKIKVI